MRWANSWDNTRGGGRRTLDRTLLVQLTKASGCVFLSIHCAAGACLQFCVLLYLQPQLLQLVWWLRHRSRHVTIQTKKKRFIALEYILYEYSSMLTTSIFMLYHCAIDSISNSVVCGSCCVPANTFRRSVAVPDCGCENHAPRHFCPMSHIFRIHYNPAHDAIFSAGGLSLLPLTVLVFFYFAFIFVHLECVTVVCGVCAFALYRRN